ncbi:hypothetical protein [Natronococcus wangiae]|uniref:hypothetical protein n=1 Tax=Natronococcus wangiae TaxID=3068275 RepID=UPI00273E4F13|nr:hypothetical protein [Natronococcus sp. AD5]
MGFRAASSESTRSNARLTTSLVTPVRVGRIVRLAVVGIALIVLADLAARYLESVGPAAAVDDVRKRRGGSTPSGRTRIEIGASDETARTEAATDPDASDDADPIDDGTNADFTAEERSPEAIDERAASDVRDEPATPGEMTIDEDVAGEVREDDGEQEDEA